jgi:hypothetical protein
MDAEIKILTISRLVGLNTFTQGGKTSPAKKLLKIVVYIFTGIKINEEKHKLVHTINRSPGVEPVTSRIWQRRQH